MIFASSTKFFKILIKNIKQHLKIVKCSFILVINILKSLVILAKIMPIAIVSRIVSAN